MSRHFKITRSQLAMVTALVSLSACDAQMQEPIESTPANLTAPKPAPTAASPAPGRAFATEKELYRFVADWAQKQNMEGVQISRDEKGEVTGVTFSSESKVDREALVKELTNGQDHVTVAGKSVSADSLRGRHSATPAAGNSHANSEAPVAAIAQAQTYGFPSTRDVCGGTFCTHNTSSYTNLWGFYTEIDGGTSQNSGGWQQTTYQLHQYSGSCGSGPTWYTQCWAPGYCYCNYCDAGDTLWTNTDTTSRGYGTKLCVHTTGTNYLSVNNTYFHQCTGYTCPSNGLEASIPFTAAGTNTAGVSQGFWAYGKLTTTCYNGYGSPEACDINGVCSRHQGFGTGGSTIVSTAAGAYDCY